MIYLESKIQDGAFQNGYRYEINDVFGKIVMQSSIKLDGEILDSITATIIKQKIPAGKIEGDIIHESGKLQYLFEKTPQWGEEKIKECENLHTKIIKPEKWYTVISRLPKKITNWCKRFAEAYQQAGKNN